MSLATPSLFNQLKETGIKPKYLANQIQIKTLTDSAIYFKQCVKMSFRLEGVFTTGTFYITSKDFGRKYQLLLGYDFLKNNKMILNFDDKTLQFKNKKIKLQFNMNDNTMGINNLTTKEISVNGERTSETNNKSKLKSKNKKKKIKSFRDKMKFAKTIENVHLKPGQEKIVKLQCPEDLEENIMILLEPIENNLKINFDASIHEINKERQVNIIIKNESEKKIFLPKDKSIGQIDMNFLIQKDREVKEIEKGAVYEVNNLSIDEVRKLREAELSPDDFKINHLPDSIRERVKNMLLANAHAFSKNYKTLGKCSKVVPRFNLTHNFPIQAKPYKINQNIKEYAKKEIQELLEANIIQKSDSNYAFPVIFVRKKSNDNKETKFRMAIDFRLLNEILESYPYPIPDIKEILQNISAKKYYTVLDLHSAFFQILVRPEDSYKLAFITENGRYSFLRLPFGTKLSTGVFANLINDTLGHFDKSEVSYFVDDVILAANSLEEMINLIDRVLKTLIENNLTIDPAKMQICLEEIEFLGFSVNEKGYSPSKKNLNKIQSLVRPKNKKAVKSLLGLANYFRSLIKNYSTIVDPLINLTKDNVKFTWDEKAEQAFKDIQTAILQNPTLRPPDYTKEFYLITDGSKVAISGILAQKIDGELLPIEFFGRKLREPEKKYHSLKFELLAVHESVMHFKHMLAGRRFQILTDSEALAKGLNIEKQSDIMARWLEHLQEFDFSFGHIQGETNPADYISRNINNLTIIELQNNLFAVNQAISDKNVKEQQLQDEKLNNIIEKIKNKKENKNTKKYALNAKEILILKPGTDNKELLIAPENLKLEIIEEAHKPHFAFKKTYDIIKTRFHWTGMYRDIKTYCNNCIPCNQTKQHPKIKVPIQKVIKDHEVGHAIHCDVIGLLPMSFKKNKFILTIIDSTSRFLEAVPLRNVEAQTILNVLNKYFAAYGLPKQCTMDNAKYFRADVFKEYLKTLGIEPHFASAYHPVSNGIAEVANKVLKNSIVAMSSRTLEWDTRLDFFKLCYNSSVHRATGFTPSMMFFAREIKTPFSVHLPAQEICSKEYVKNRVQHIKEVKLQALANQEKIMKEYINEEELKRVKFLEKGQHCYLKCVGHTGALDRKHEGPFEVKLRFRNNNYLLKDLSNPQRKLIKRHIDKLFCTTKVNYEEVDQKMDNANDGQNSSS